MCANGILTEYSTRRWTYLYFGCTFPQEKGIACVIIHRRPKIAPKKARKEETTGQGNGNLISNFI